MSDGPPHPPVDAASDLADPERDASRPRPRRTWKQRVLLSVGIVVVLGCLSAVAAAGYGWYRYNQIDRQDLALTKAQGEVMNYLIVGSDNRDVVNKSDADSKAFLSGHDDSGGQRSDTIMVARVDTGAKTIDLLSFPRDLWIPIAGTHGSERINGAYSLGGAQQLIDTIQQDFGIEINHYVEVNFKSFKGIVNAVDGVPMYFDHPMRDTNSGLYVDNPGCVKLDGDQALAFSRARHLEYQDDKGRWKDDPTGDLGRITRQQTFIRRVIDRAQGKVTGLNLAATNDLFGATVQNLSVDKGFDLGGMISLAKQFKDFTGDAVQSHTLPVSAWTTDGGADVLRLDTDGAQDVLNIFRGLPPGSYPPSAVTVGVQNGSGVVGQAQEAEDALRAAGFHIDGEADTVKSVDKTSVHFAPGSDRGAVEVARYLPAGTVLKQDPNLRAGHIVLVTGRDFTSVLTEPLPEGSVATTTTTVPGSKSTSGTSKSGSHTSTTLDGSSEIMSEPVGVTPGDPPDGVSCG